MVKVTACQTCFLGDLYAVDKIEISQSLSSNTGVVYYNFLIRAVVDGTPFSSSCFRAEDANTHVQCIPTSVGLTQGE